jgi:opacity protein-like surface antigen
MKRILSLVLGTVFIATFAATAGATSSNGNLEINAGYAKSSTDVTGNNESMGGGIGFGAGYWRNASPKVTWGAELGYDGLGSVDYNYVDGSNVSQTVKVSESVFRVSPQIRYNFGQQAHTNFFVQGGAGLYSVSANVKDSGTSTDLSDSQSAFGYNVGAGVGFPVGTKTTMNFQGMYNSAQTDGQSTNYLAFRAGVGFGL